MPQSIRRISHSINLATNQSINQSVNQSTSQPINQTTDQSVSHLSMNQKTRTIPPPTQRTQQINQLITPSLILLYCNASTGVYSPGLRLRGRERHSRGAQLRHIDRLLAHARRQADVVANLAPRAARDIIGSHTGGFCFSRALGGVF